MSDTFAIGGEAALGERFLAEGHVIVPAEDMDALDRIRAHVAGLAAAHLGIDLPGDVDGFLNTVDERVDVAALNAFRLAVIAGINATEWFRPAYLATARGAIENLVGNELAMQRRINLSVQLPDDKSSLLPLHADVWSGDSPFEVVLWIPLVDCTRTKSMYIVPPAPDRKFQAHMSELADKSSEELYQAVSGDARFLDVPYGQVLIFSQTLMHGNRVNEEPGTRWTMNCRFKSVFSPYADKKLGEFFEPVTLRANTRFALEYQLPEGFEG